MSWFAVGGAAASVVGGVVASNKASGDAKRAMKQQAAYQDQELALQREGLDFAREQYYDHKAKFDPLFYDIREMMDDVEPDFGLIAGDVNTSIDTARGMEERDMRRYGIKPTDGAARQSQRDYGIRRATAHVGARSKAREGAKDKRYARYADLYSAGMGIGSNNAAAVSAAYQNNANALGGAGINSFNNAAYYNNQAGQAAQGWGNIVGGIDWQGIINGVKGWGANTGTSTGSGSAPTNTGTGTSGMWSDARLKDNLVLVGTVYGINIYAWDWNDTARKLGVTEPCVGVIAQEHLDSGYVYEDESGYFKVDYDGLFAHSKEKH